MKAITELLLNPKISLFLNNISIYYYKMHMFTDSKFMKHLNVIHDSVELCSAFNNENTATHYNSHLHILDAIYHPLLILKPNLFFHSPYIHSFEPVSRKRQLFTYLGISATLQKRSQQQWLCSQQFKSSRHVFAMSKCNGFDMCDMFLGIRGVTLPKEKYNQYQCFENQSKILFF